MKEIAYTVTAAKALKRHANQAARIRAKIEQYAADPASLANKVIILSGVDARRLRVGEFRVIFKEIETTITVLDIGPRGGIYD